MVVKVAIWREFTIYPLNIILRLLRMLLILGSKYKNEYVGNCKYSSITVFSFHPVKIITTAEEASSMTNDPKLAQIMNRNRTHGIEKDRWE